MMEKTKLTCMGFFRNGDVQYSFYDVGAYADDVHLTVKKDGSRELEYRDYDQNEYKENV